MRPLTSLVVGLALATLLPVAGASHASAADRLPCARIAYQPNRQFSDRRSCTSRWSPSELSGVDVVMIGAFTDVANPLRRGPRPDRCAEPFSHAANARVAERMRQAAQAAARAAPPVLHLHRFDLVPVQLAEQPGFRTSFLLRTLTPFADVVAQFRAERCGRPCQWSEAEPGAPKPALRELVDRSGGAGTSERVVYYLARPQPDQPGQWPAAAVGDLWNAPYRRWRVDEAARALRAGSYDAILLNQKFYEYAPSKAYWLGSNKYPDARAFLASGETLFSAEPSGYPFVKYVAGWAALGRELKAADVPYAVWISSSAWGARSVAQTDERMREAARGAMYALLQLPEGPRPPYVERAAADLRAHGVAVYGVCGDPGARR